jgi:hypothetical protein
VGYDEPAQYEKEVDEKICVSDEIEGIDRAEDVEVKYRHQQCGNAAPAVQHTKMHFGVPCLRQGRIIRYIRLDRHTNPPLSPLIATRLACAERLQRPFSAVPR